MISKACKYAIRATIYIASASTNGRKLSIKEVASEIEAPPAFTAKILQTISKYKIVSSTKGPYGGFYCEKYQLELPIIEIVNAIDGLAVFNDCIMGLHQCSDDHPCPMHFQYVETRKIIKDSFQNSCIKDLLSDYEKGATFLKNPF